MSIPNIIDKIKSKTGIDKLTLFYVTIIVGVGVGAFGLGRLSVLDTGNVKGDISVTETGNLLENMASNKGDNSAEKEQGTQEKRYVASKNGKMYYSVGCSGGNRIKAENQIWFSTQSDAEKSGYTLASSCK